MLAARHHERRNGFLDELADLQGPGIAHPGGSEVDGSKVRCVDAYHRQVHGKEHGGRDTRRPFSGIRLASNRARQKAPDLDEAVSALLARELARGSCAIFGVSKDSADQGHAVAIERRTAGDFHLFDPNIGIYAIASEDKLKGAIRWLFETKYGMTGSTRECDWEVYNLAR